MNTFLCWKFNQNWPFDTQRALRQLTKNDQRKVFESIDRQKQLRNIKTVPTDAIVSDLSAGFWVSLLNKSYDIPFSWRYNLGRIFPNEKSITRETASELCDNMLYLRNRVAHHEAIYHLPLDDRRGEMDRLLRAMSPVAHQYVNETCTFAAVWAARHKPTTTAAT
jgi:hypothetical protein